MHRDRREMGYKGLAFMLIVTAEAILQYLENKICKKLKDRIIKCNKIE
jgi:hypothetical protein